TRPDPPRTRPADDRPSACAHRAPCRRGAPLSTRTASSMDDVQWEEKVRRSRRRGRFARSGGLLGRGIGVAAVLLFTLFPVYFMLMSAFSDSTTSGTGALL